jgi:hypothetical protein
MRELIYVDNLSSVESLEIGDIVLYKAGDDFFSKCVRFFTKSNYVHVSMLVSNDLVIEANWNKKSNIVPFRYNQKKMEIYRVIGGLTTEQKFVLLKSSYLFLNKKYDYPQIFGYIVKYFFKSKSNIFNSPNKIICSELIDRSYLKAGIDLLSENLDGDISPDEIIKSNKLCRVL